MASKDYYKKVLESIKLNVNEDVVDDVFRDEILMRMQRQQKGMSKLDKLQNISKVVKL